MAETLVLPLLQRPDDTRAKQEALNFRTRRETDHAYGRRNDQRITPEGHHGSEQKNTTY
jgi:hypothetical protein